MVSACAWFVAVQHVGSWIKILEACNLTQERIAPSWKREHNLTQRLASQGGQLFIRNTLSEGFIDISGRNIPAAHNSF